MAVDNQDLDTAASELQWALDNSPAPATERLVRLRLARVEAARGNIDSALQMVQGIDAAEMKSAYEEAKGDFYLLQTMALLLLRPMSLLWHPMSHRIR